MGKLPHVARVLCGPLRGVHSTHTLSGQQFGRHWHDTYGFGVLEEGAQRSASGRGRVDAFAGQVITSNPGATEALACEESLVEAAVLLVARHGTVRLFTDAPNHDLRRLRDRLADAPTDTPSLAEMAAMTGLSRYQLLRRFEKVYGLPPHAWLVSHRAEYALRLIRGGETLADAATASGFADQSHMTRAFVRHYGFTPGAWRKAAALQ